MNVRAGWSVILPALALAASATQHTLHNSAVTAAFSNGRLVALSDSKTSIAVAGDDFQIELDGAPSSSRTTVLSSAGSSVPPTLQPGANASSLAVWWEFKGLTVEVR